MIKRHLFLVCEVRTESILRNLDESDRSLEPIRTKSKRKCFRILNWRVRAACLFLNAKDEACRCTGISISYFGKNRVEESFLFVIFYFLFFFTRVFRVLLMTADKRFVNGGNCNDFQCVVSKINQTLHVDLSVASVESFIIAI